MAEPPTRAPRWRRAHCVIAFVLLLPACEDDSVRPAPAEAPLFYPLAIGSNWHFDHARTVRFLTADGLTEVRPPLELRDIFERALTGTEQIAGTEYVTEREIAYALDAPDTVVSWRRYRQDATGLFRAVVPVAVPPGAVPPVDSLAEVPVLTYPLEAGSEWHTSTAVLRSVEALDTLSIPAGTMAGYRIRITRPADGADDEHHEWYGSAGLLKTRDHVEVLASDVLTGEVVRIVSDDTAELSGFAPKNLAEAPGGRRGDHISLRQ